MSPVLQRVSCAKCRKGHQKCTLDASETACDRCIDLGFECELPQLLAEVEVDDYEAQNEPGPEPTSSSHDNNPVNVQSNAQPRSRTKCDTCRRHHMTCNPSNRVWPQKCQRCTYKGYECGPPRSKKDFDDAAAMETDDSPLLGATGQRKRRRRKPQPQPHSEDHFQPIVSDVVYTAGAAAPAGGDDDDGDDGDDRSSTDGSIPAAPPAKRQAASGPSNAAGPPPPKRQARGKEPAHADDEKLVQYKGMVRTMEEEFREVLRGEQAKHERELNALRTELNQQRERYEARIDDLIKILGSTIASKT